MLTNNQILIMFYVSYGCSYLDGAASWRVPWALQMLPGIFLGFMLFLLPESPRWLAKKDRWEEAHQVLANVHAKGDREAPFVLAELQDIREMCEFERAHADASYLELFKGNMIYRTHVGMFTQIWSQLTGKLITSYHVKQRLTSSRHERHDVVHHLRLRHGRSLW